MCDHYYTNATIQELHRIRTLVDVRQRLLDYMDAQESEMDKAMVSDNYRLGFAVAFAIIRDYLRCGLMPICDNPPEEGEWW